MSESDQEQPFVEVSRRDDGTVVLVAQHFEPPAFPELQADLVAAAGEAVSLDHRPLAGSWYEFYLAAVDTVGALGGLAAMLQLFKRSHPEVTVVVQLPDREPVQVTDEVGPEIEADIDALLDPPASDVEG